MNTKNIILGLSLILSSVATLNLTSCSDDDDDDANHAPKLELLDENRCDSVFTSSSVGIHIETDTQEEYNSSMNLAVNTISDYFQKNLSGDANFTIGNISNDIHEIVITAHKGKISKVEAKLIEMGNNMSSLSQSLRKGVPGYKGCVFYIKNKAGKILIPFEDTVK